MSRAKGDLGRCGSCGESGHNRTTCPNYLHDVDFTRTIKHLLDKSRQLNSAVRQLQLALVEEPGLTKGSK